MKKLVSFIFATMLAGQAWADNFDFSAVCSSGQTLYYKMTSDSTVSVTYPYLFYSTSNSSYYHNYTQPSGALEIPNSVTYNNVKFTVTSIEESAFRNCEGLTSVIISNSVTSIRRYAFYGCSSLTSVTIPESVISISSCTFNNSNIYFYCAPENWPTGWYLSLGFKSDDWNGGVGTIYWGVKQPKFTDGFIYYVINDTIIPYQIQIVRYTGDSISAVIPSSVILEGEEFSVTQIHDDAFDGYNNLDYSAYGNAYYIGNEDNPYLVLMEAKNKKIESCEIHSQCRFIYDGAFSDCGNLTEIAIPESVTDIGGNVFSNCIELTSITIPDGVARIGNSTFSGCSRLEFVSIPNSITQIGDNAFYNCSNLKSVIIPDSVIIIGKKAFFNCSSLTSISIPESMKSIGNSAFANCSSLQKTVFSSIENLCNIKFNGENANPLSRTRQLYVGGEKIVNLVIPETVKTIGNYAFYNCSSIASLSISNSVKIIGAMAFFGCSSLVSIEIPNSVTEIYGNAFDGCYGLKSLSYNSNAIGAHFNNISALESIFIGDSVKNISGTEFNGCDNLVNVISLATVPPALNGDPYTFADTIWVPASSVDAYKAAPVWKRKEIMPLDYYTISVAETDTVRGYVIGGGNFAAKQAITIYAIPTNTYHFKTWSDGNTDNPRTIMLNADVNVSAIFEGDECTIIVNNDITGSVTGWENSHYGDTITLTATPTNGYHFVKWSDGTTANPRSIIVTNDTTFNALFEINTYTISASAENGIVSGADTYNYGENVALTAMANNGYHFVKWSDGNTENPRIITVNGDFELTAVFEIDENPEGSENYPGTAVAENTTNALNIYAHGKTIVVENASEEIRVYNAMGVLVGRDSINRVHAEITANTTGIYIVKTGGTVKRVMVN